MPQLYLTFPAPTAVLPPPPPPVEYECAFLKYHESEGGVVALFEGLAYPLRARILLVRGLAGHGAPLLVPFQPELEPGLPSSILQVGPPACAEHLLAACVETLSSEVAGPCPSLPLIPACLTPPGL